MSAKVVGVKETRMRDGKLEGLVMLDDGTEEWRAPSKVEVEITAHHSDGTSSPVQVTDAKVTV